SWPLFTNRWKSGAIAPAGHLRIASFHLDDSVPVWSYEVGDQAIEARIWMEPGAHTTYAAWRLQPAAARSRRMARHRRLAAALARRLDHDRTVLATAFPSSRPQQTPPWIARLALAADAFLFARPLANVPDGMSVIAGYPWFGDWGRDTM